MCVCVVCECQNKQRKQKRKKAVSTKFYSMNILRLHLQIITTATEIIISWNFSRAFDNESLRENVAYKRRKFGWTEIEERKPFTHIRTKGQTNVKSNGTKRNVSLISSINVSFSSLGRYMADDFFVLKCRLIVSICYKTHFQVSTSMTKIFYIANKQSDFLK